jgi:predicted nucleic acid-binding protein
LSATAPSAEEQRLYADASALVKLIVQEPESAELVDYLGEPLPQLTTSGLALVEVTRAVRIARPQPDALEDVTRLFRSCVLLEVTGALLRQAAALASEQLRSLDAVHLASIVRLDAHRVLAYDRRLAGAARDLGFTVEHPGAER